MSAAGRVVAVLGNIVALVADVDLRCVALCDRSASDAVTGRNRVARDFVASLRLSDFLLLVITAELRLTG